MTTDPTQPQYGEPNDGYTAQSPYGQPTYPQPGTPQTGYTQAYPQPGIPQTGYTQAYPQPGIPQTGYTQAGVPYGPANYGVDAYGRPLSDKSKVVAGVLGIALGFFGAGRFYIGDTKTGVLQLLVSVFTCGLGHIWGLVDGIMILVNGGVDAQGRVLRD